MLLHQPHSQELSQTAFTLDGSGTVIMSNNGIPTTDDMTVDSGVTFQSTAAITGKKIKGLVI